MKAMVLVLMMAALAVALFCLLSGHRPSLPDRAGLRRRFVLAVLLFVGLLGCSLSPEGYDPETAQAKIAAAQHQQRVVETLREVWRSLDPDQSEAFASAASEMETAGRLRGKTMRILVQVFRELAMHRRMTGPAAPMCYRMAPDIFPSIESRASLLKQVESLRAMRAAGTLDAATARAAQMALATEIAALTRAGSLRGIDQAALRQLAADREAGRVLPGDAETEAARYIVAFEGGPVPAPTPAQRLVAMRRRVAELLDRGPIGNDWRDPALRPNVHAILDAHLPEGVPEQISCYDRLAIPVPERSAELAALQQRLQDAAVQAGVLDVELVERLAAAEAADGQLVDEALESDVAAWQRQVRRTMRLLYQAGEVPSDFVRQVEAAVDVPILALDPAKALGEDVRWYLQTLWWNDAGPVVFGAMEQAGLLPPARTHHGRYYHTQEPSRHHAAVDRFISALPAIDASGGVTLPGDDEAPAIPSWQVPAQGREQRLRLRGALRLLVSLRLVAPDQLACVEAVLGLPLLGTISP